MIVRDSIRTAEAESVALLRFQSLRRFAAQRRAGVGVTTREREGGEIRGKNRGDRAVCKCTMKITEPVIQARLAILLMLSYATTPRQA